MKQIKYIEAYNLTNELSRNTDLSINAKWILYKLRKILYPHYEFYIRESRELFDKYETTAHDDVITFESPELAIEYTTKQAEIDNLEIDEPIEQLSLKLSDIPNITIQQIELLDGFIEFIPE